MPGGCNDGNTAAVGQLSIVQCDEPVYSGDTAGVTGDPQCMVPVDGNH